MKECDSHPTINWTAIGGVFWSTSLLDRQGRFFPVGGDYSIRTEEAYVQAIRRFILYHKKRHPREMGVDEIRQYLSHLAIDCNVAASTQNVALCALLFLYRQVLGIDLPLIEKVERAKRPKRVPVVFTPEEVRRVLANIHGTHLISHLALPASTRGV